MPGIIKVVQLIYEGEVLTPMEFYYDDDTFAGLETLSDVEKKQLINRAIRTYFNSFIPEDKIFTDKNPCIFFLNIYKPESDKFFDRNVKFTDDGTSKDFEIGRQPLYLKLKSGKLLTIDWINTEALIHSKRDLSDTPNFIQTLCFEREPSADDETLPFAQPLNWQSTDAEPVTNVTLPPSIPQNPLIEKKSSSNNLLSNIRNYANAGATAGSIFGATVGTVAGIAAGFLLGTPFIPFSFGLSLVASVAICSAIGTAVGAATGAIIGGLIGAVIGIGVTLFSKDEGKADKPRVAEVFVLDSVSSPRERLQTRAALTTALSAAPPTAALPTAVTAVPTTVPITTETTKLEHNNQPQKKWVPQFEPVDSIPTPDEVQSLIDWLKSNSAISVNRTQFAIPALQRLKEDVKKASENTDDDNDISDFNNPALRKHSDLFIYKKYTQIKTVAEAKAEPSLNTNNLGTLKRPQ